MPDYLLLRDKTICPACRRRTWPVHFSGCKNCGVLLFLRSIDFNQYEADGGIREYYLFNTVNGWMHSTHLKNPKANAREYKAPKLADDYGRHTTPDAVAAKGLKL